MSMACRISHTGNLYGFMGLIYIYIYIYEIGLLEHVRKRFISNAFKHDFPFKIAATWSVSRFSGQTHLELCV